MPAKITRRQTLDVLGAAVAAAVVPRGLLGQTPAFPKGAIIRTILKDYAPEELAGGATLFHEHLQLAADFGARFGAAAAAARAANGLPPIPPRPGGTAPPPGPDIMHDVDLMTAEVKRRVKATLPALWTPGTKRWAATSISCARWP
jgi:hypothetical protein